MANRALNTRLPWLHLSLAMAFLTWPLVQVRAQEETLEPAATETPAPLEVELEAPSGPSSQSLPFGIAPGTRRVVGFETRPGVTLKLVLLAPLNPPKAVLLLFPGGNGAGSFSERNGQVRLGSNFLVRSAPLFAEQGHLAAVVDVPSDQAAGMSDQFRTSTPHVQDVRLALDAIGQADLPAFLVGTSRGTISTAHLGIALQDQRVKGAVLTSSMAHILGSRAASLSLVSLPLERLKLPVLFVHHRDDGCVATRHQDALLLPARMSANRDVSFVTIEGGEPPRSDPCEALSAHGFLGKESEAVEAITSWLAILPLT